MVDIVKDLERAVELRPRASRKLPQGPELVERRLTVALGLRGVEGLVVETVLHAHPVAWAKQKELVDYRAASSFLGNQSPNRDVNL